MKTLVLSNQNVAPSSHQEPRFSKFVEFAYAGYQERLSFSSSIDATSHDASLEPRSSEKHIQNCDEVVGSANQNARQMAPVNSTSQVLSLQEQGCKILYLKIIF